LQGLLRIAISYKQGGAAKQAAAAIHQLVDLRPDFESS
jgi:hypothetical protein